MTDTQAYDITEFTFGETVSLVVDAIDRESNPLNPAINHPMRLLVSRIPGGDPLINITGAPTLNLVNEPTSSWLMNLGSASYEDKLSEERKYHYQLETQAVGEDPVIQLHGALVLKASINR